MSRFPELVAAACVSACLAVTPAAAQKYGLGREALPEEVQAWDIDVRPDGQGLPEGSGTVELGEEIFAAQCASCHGDFGEGVDRWPVLVGGQDTLASQNPVKTIGSYWPFASTVFDYIYRAMPFGNAQSLEPDEVYAITAYLLYMNEVVEDDFELSKANFAEVRLPNEENFITDARPDTPTLTQGEPCMKDCKQDVKVTMRARILDVTPDEEEPEAESQVAATDPNALDTALVEEGQGLFKKRCISCHEVTAGKHKTGPSLEGIVGRPAGTTDGFRKYSKQMVASGLTWDDASLDAFLEKPRNLIKGTRMSFGGLRKEEQRKAIIEYLKSISQP